jgi:glycosyltransferase involved in cell wall biosynthesis
MDSTAAALRGRGLGVEHARRMAADDPFDLVHAIGNGADIWQNLEHWRKNPAPLVVSPVIVCSPGTTELKLRLGARLGRIPNVNSMTRDILRRADSVIALTGYERDLVRKLAGRDTKVTVIDNGVDRVTPAAENPVPAGDPYVLMLGSISERKGQARTLQALGNKYRFVVVGGIEGNGAERDRWQAAVDASRAEWLGEIHDPAVVARILIDAGALVLFSRAEVQSLAVLEALAYGTPVVASDIPSHVEMDSRWPGWVKPVADLDVADEALNGLLSSPPAGPAPDVSTWDEVAARVEGVYRELLPSAT